VGIDSSDTDFDTAGETGGAKTHTLTKQEIPPHTHSYVKTDSTSNADGYDNNTNAKTVTGPTETGGGNIGENSDGTGNASPHNNLQPYIVVYMWKRTA
jgi:microcystin-dependent protein